MGKLRKLRSRFISSIGAVKRSVLRRQSQSNSSTASNPTTLTRLASLDSAVPASTGAGGSQAQKRKLQARLQGQEQGELQLHWNEARRIYSEPVQATHGLSRGEENICSTEATDAGCHNLPCAGDQEQLDRGNTRVGDSAQGDGSQISDEEDYDDVFLQSWEETGW